MSPPELFTADLEEELKRLRTELIIQRKRVEGEWILCIGVIEQGRRNMENDARKWLHLSNILGLIF